MGLAREVLALVLQLSVDLSLLFLLRFRCWAVAVAVLMLVSEAAAPGAVHTRDPASRASLPFATPAIVTNLLRLVDRPRAFTVVGVFVLLGTRLWDPSWAVTPVGRVNTVLQALAVLYPRARSDLLDSLRERAERAEREQVLLAEERRLLVEEMHDVVTHGVARRGARDRVG